ncbi:EAL domain-containing protein [Aquabacterium sp.]|uniref:bifunctional diguanylate cyclase/phosphodiesterase n=1 Tax=Aquabacterium sp. TaxID=1872578 RepID=UPI0037834A1D
MLRSPLPDLPPAARTVLHWAWRSLLVVLAFGLTSRLALWLPGGSPALAAVWPPTGIALAVLLRWGTPYVPAVVLANLVVAWGAGAKPWAALGIALGSTGGAWLAARWMARAGFNRRLEQRRDLGLLIGAGAGAGTLLSAANGAIWLAASGRITGLDLPIVWFQWWVSETLGLLLTGVPLLCFGARSWSRAFAGRHRYTTLGLLLGSLAAAGLGMVGPAWLGTGALAWWVLPPVLLCWLAMRSGLALASGGVLALAAGLLLATGAGIGPFAAGMASAPVNSPPILLWAYLTALLGLVLLPHVLIGELARLEERWQLALDGSDLGVADWDLRTGDGFTSPRWRALMDDPGGTQTNTIERWLARVHPDERATLRSALASVDSPQGSGLRHEARVRVRDGWCWFDVHVIVIERDADGAPQRVVASLSDIGARRSAEDRQQLSSNLFMHLHEGLLITDAEFRVIDANPTYSQITGVPREELLGTVPSLLKPAAPDPISRQQQASLWAALRSTGNWVGELVERRRGGEPCALHVTVSTVHGPDGALRYHVIVVSDVTEQRLQRERLERQANFDELTRLPNRARLSQLLADAMVSTDREGYLMAVCYLDLDHFKAINERFGHQAGDRLLAELALRLRTALRARGTVWSDVAARLGGDEFALLLRAGTVEEARAAVERVLRVVSQPITIAPDVDPIAVTASVGATIYPLDSSDADTLLRHADHAMYGAKQSGRNGYLFFDTEHSRRAEERVIAIGRVQDALDRNELTLYFQPKVDLKRGVVLGFEALLRWNHPEHGLVPPAQFLPLIEHTGLSARIGDHVLAKALDQLDAWTTAGLDLTVSVNISARHLQEPDFAQRLAELLARHARPLGPKLELEVLETAALTDIGFTSSLLERCARLGVRWALDDFGTGYSTLTYLKRLPVQVLKIDRSFVLNMLTDAQDRAIVEGVISLARTFDCIAVAEGVESPAQARMLLDMGCEVGQGAGIASPMPASDVAGWVREWRGLFALSATAGGAVGTPVAPVTRSQGLE